MNKKKTTLPPQFGRYRILRSLGSGAMGAVFLAEDTQLDRQVALKTPTVDADGDSEQLVERFFREGRAAAAVQHPNLCPVYDLGTIDGTHYITMAYIEGRPLSDYLSRGRPIDQRQAATLVGKLAQGLAVAHQNGVVHRDLKPANIMIQRSTKEPIVMDFGLALLRTGADTSRMTHEGTLMGTPAYMSPEQIEAKNDQIGPASDQYSLGVILYELLTGRLPFDGPVHSVLAGVLTRTPDPPSALRKNLDSQLAALCMKMMARSAEDRFPSMHHASQAMSDWLQTSTADSASIRPFSDREHGGDPFQSFLAQRDRVAKNERLGDDTPQTPRPAWQPIVGGVASVAVIATAIFLFSRVDISSDADESSPRGEDTAPVVGQKEVLPPPVEERTHWVYASGSFRFDEERQLWSEDTPNAGKLLYEEVERNHAFIALDAISGDTSVRYRLFSDRIDWAKRPDGDFDAKKLAFKSLDRSGHWEPAETAPPPLAVMPFDEAEAKDYQERWAKFLDVPVEFSATFKGRKMTFRLIPPGEFDMGSTQAELDECLRVTNVGQRNHRWLRQTLQTETPQHHVMLTRPVFVGIHEVTVGQFRAFVQATDYATQVEELEIIPQRKIGPVWRFSPGMTWRMRLMFKQTDDHPVTVMTGQDGLAFCEWMREATGLHVRLLSEAEWEFAARSGSTGWFHFERSRIDEHAWSSSNSERTTQPVGQLQPNPFGLFDMHGNVRELCRDLWSVDAYANATIVDPDGPTRGEWHVGRGGAYTSVAPAFLRSAKRDHATPPKLGDGFRVACDAESVRKYLAERD